MHRQGQEVYVDGLQRFVKATDAFPGNRRFRALQQHYHAQIANDTTRSAMKPKLAGAPGAVLGYLSQTVVGKSNNNNGKNGGALLLRGSKYNKGRNEKAGIIKSQATACTIEGSACRTGAPTVFGIANDGTCQQTATLSPTGVPNFGLTCVINSCPATPITNAAALPVPCRTTAGTLGVCSPAGNSLCVPLTNACTSGVNSVCQGVTSGGVVFQGVCNALGSCQSREPCVGGNGTPCNSVSSNGPSFSGICQDGFCQPQQQLVSSQCLVNGNTCTGVSASGTIYSGTCVNGSCVVPVLGCSTAGLAQTPCLAVNTTQVGSGLSGIFITNPAAIGIGGSNAIGTCQPNGTCRTPCCASLDTLTSCVAAASPAVSANSQAALQEMRRVLNC